MKKIYLALLISLLSICISYGQKPVANFVASQDTLCTGDCINFTDSSTNNPTSWLWIFQGGIPSSSTMQNPPCITNSKSDSITVTLIASNANGSDTLTKKNFITIKLSPPVPCISQKHDTLFCSTDSSYVSYQWYYDSIPIPGATDTFFVITQSGNWNVMVTNAAGCSATGNSCPNGIESFYDERNISLYPDPAATQLTIHSSSLLSNENVMVSIMNVLGEIVQEESRKWTDNIYMNINNLAAGIYFLQMQSESGSVVKKFVKE